MPDNDSEILDILAEVTQAPKKRQELLKKWSKANGDRNVISYFCSHNKIQAMINDDDRDVIESILQKLNKNKPLDLIIDSPGGLPLPAERIINVCRTYSRKFRVVVPKLAKSAATMIALGADEILLGETSELGPIDPQMRYIDQNGRETSRSAYSLLNGVKELLDEIKNLQANQQIAGFLSLMPRVDKSFLKDCENAQDLSRDIVIKFLKKTTFPSLMETEEAVNNSLRNASQQTQQQNQTVQSRSDSIEKKIEIFLNPEMTHSHGRGIMYKDAKKVGLNVNLLRKNETRWKLLLKIYYRTNWLTKSREPNITKVIESQQDSYSFSAMA